MPYAAVSDVAALNVGRATYSATTKPTASQVALYLTWTAAELDATLRGAGYDTPVPTTADEAYALLTAMNAMGAACLVERSAQNSPDRDTWCAAYIAGKELLATLELPGLDKGDGGSARYSTTGTSVFQGTAELAGQLGSLNIDESALNVFTRDF